MRYCLIIHNCLDPCVQRAQRCLNEQWFFEGVDLLIQQSDSWEWTKHVIISSLPWSNSRTSWARCLLKTNTIEPFHRLTNTMTPVAYVTTWLPQKPAPSKALESIDKKLDALLESSKKRQVSLTPKLK